MHSLQKTNLTRHARIKLLKSNIERSMHKLETLGLESLGLEKPATPWNASRANEGTGKHAEDKASLSSRLQQASGHHTSYFSSWSPSAVPSYQPLPTAPLGSSVDNLNHWPSQAYHHGFVQISLGDPRDHCVQASIPPPGLPRYEPQGNNGPSTAPGVTAVPFVQSKVPSRAPKPAVQKSTLSVLTHRGLPSSRVDKQYRYSNANPPLTEATTRQHGRCPGLPPATIRKALSQLSGSSQSKTTRDLEPTNPLTCKNSPLIIRGKDDLKYLRPPIPTSAYLGNALAIPELLPSPQRLLLILDLNGTLLYRHPATLDYIPRPSLHKFLKYAFANHSLLVWSSAKPYAVKGICMRLFSRGQREMLLGEWGRDTLGLTSAQYKERVQVYKRLDRIWGDEKLQLSHPDFEAGARWGQHNTVLIDDARLKASAQPFNHIELPEFMRGGVRKEGDGRYVLGQVMGYLEEARKWSNISRFIRHGPFEKWQEKKAQGRDQCEVDGEDGGVGL